MNRVEEIRKRMKRVNVRKLKKGDVVTYIRHRYIEVGTFWRKQDDGGLYNVFVLYHGAGNIQLTSVGCLYRGHCNKCCSAALRLLRRNNPSASPAFYRVVNY